MVDALIQLAGQFADKIIEYELKLKSAEYEHEEKMERISLGVLGLCGWPGGWACILAL